MRAYVTEEIFVTAPDRVGLLAQVSAAIADAGVNIIGICAYRVDGQGEFMILTGDNDAAASAVTALGVGVQSKDVAVVELPETVGALAETAARIADAGIDIHWLFATSGDGRHAKAVFGCEDPAALVAVLT